MKKLYNTFFRQGPENEKFEKFSLPASAIPGEWEWKNTKINTKTEAQTYEVVDSLQATKRKRKRNKKKKETDIVTEPEQVAEAENIIIDDADLSGDQMVAEFELKLQQLKVLVLSQPKGEKLKPNTSPSWIDGLKRK